MFLFYYLIRLFNLFFFSNFLLFVITYFCLLLLPFMLSHNKCNSFLIFLPNFYDCLILNQSDFSGIPPQQPYPYCALLVQLGFSLDMGLNSRFCDLDSILFEMFLKSFNNALRFSP